MNNGKILIIDDDESFSETLDLYLTELNYTTFKASDGKTGIDLLFKENPDLVITDMKMPGYDGLEVLKRTKEFDDSIQVILITAFDDMETTIKAMQMGAYDYIEKTLELERINSVVKKAYESRKLSEKLSIKIEDSVSSFQLENNLIGRTAGMKEIAKKIGMISANRVNVLIQGESGTGKELIAKIIHYSGMTKKHPLIAVNCTALSETLLESELFGHVKGSFTGAYKDKKGKFELAGEGTIFLDEISEISHNLQVKLLRVLQEKEFEKVGGEETVVMKARIITASNKNLEELVKEGKFREDLYYRLKVFTINIPPLRERKEDIPNLVVHFLKKINKDLKKNVWKIPYDVMEFLQGYEWLGNVRELENTLIQAVVMAKGDVLEKNLVIKQHSPFIQLKVDKSKLSLAEIEKEHIMLVLNSVKWDKLEASKILGIAKTTLYNKLEAYSITEPGK